MHQVIRLIVYSENETEARGKAEHILNEELVGENGTPFDYGTFFDDNTSSASGKARWGNLPSVVLADSKEGKKLIKEGMKFTKDEFFKNLKKIRKLIDEYSDEEIFEEKVLNVKKLVINELKEKTIENPLNMIKYYFSCLGRYVGSDIFLYDNDGEGIRDSKHLETALNKWKCIYEDKGLENPYKDLKVFVVPIDVHY